MSWWWLCVMCNLTEKISYKQNLSIHIRNRLRTKVFQQILQVRSKLTTTKKKHIKPTNKKSQLLMLLWTFTVYIVF